MTRRAPLPALAVLALLTAALLFGTTGASYGADPTATNDCRDVLGIVGPCQPCPFSKTEVFCDIDNQPRIEKYPTGNGCKFNTRADAGADERYEKGCEPYGYGIVPYEVRPLPLRLVSQTSTTITLGWDPPSGADGYRFSRSDSAKRPHTWDGQRSTVVFGKGAAWYRVEVIRIGEQGEYRP